MEFQTGQELAKTLEQQAIFSAWVGAGLPGQLSAQSELLRCLEGDGTVDRRDPSPFFAAIAQTESGQAWTEALLADQPDARSRETCRANLEKLQGGEAQVVVTGQQPGALGGPLYTLYKAAATVALAQLRTMAGQPTVPVFWSGDDDDDLAEALAVQGYDPWENRLFGAADSPPGMVSGQLRRPCVGNLNAARWSTRESQWLNEDRQRARLPVLGLDLADLWATACAEEWPWHQLNRRFLLRVFQGTGLVVVSGNDPFLHHCADPLYQQILPRRQELAGLAAQCGKELADLGFPVPISDRSLHRHLFVTEGRGRRFLEIGEDPVARANLRPGVLLRSPVQDWLLEPAAVVVGPGELAYLRQLDPLYEALGIDRCPLAPRFFGWIVPPNMSGDDLTDSQPGNTSADKTPEALADQATRVAVKEVRRILEEELGVGTERAAQLAAGRGRRWGRGVAAMFRGEAAGQAARSRESYPVWVFPEGKRQERVLASLTVAALWGDDLVAAMCAAAKTHFTKGRLGQWHEFVGRVADPAGKVR